MIDLNLADLISNIIVGVLVIIFVGGILLVAASGAGREE